MPEFNINTDELVSWLNELEKIHKSAMPVSVRGALNDVAFYMKKKELNKAFDKQFIVRSRSFIRSHTAVNKSPNTFYLKEMYSEVGVIAGKPGSKGLKAQELGSQTRKTKNLAFFEQGKQAARIGGKHKKKIQKKHYLTKVSPIRITDRHRSPFKSSKFRKTAFKGGKGTYINYNGLIGVVKNIKSRPLFIKFDILYIETNNENFKLKKSPFLKPAGEKAYGHFVKFFKRRAARKIKPKIKRR